MLAHSANMQPLTNTTGVMVKFVGVKDKKDVDIAYLTLNVDNEKEFIDFSAVFKKPSQTYDSYYIKMRGLTEEYLISTTTVIASDLVEVSFQEESYFDLKKGETIEYQLKPLDKKDLNIEKINIENSNSSEFKISRDSCPKEGCKFTVEALVSSQGYIYIGEDIK